MALGDGILTSAYPVVRAVQLELVRGRAYFYFCIPTWVGVSLSAISLILLNIDRFIYFHWVLQYRILMTVQRAGIVVVFAWIVCLAHTSAGLGLLSEPHNASLNFSAENYSVWRDDPQVNQSWYLAHSILFGLIPVLSSLLLSLWLVSLRHRRRVLTATSTRQENNNWKLLRFIVVTTVWSAIALIPSRLYVLLVNFFNSKLDISLFQFLSDLTYLNPIVNPLVTLHLQKKYLTVLSAWLQCQQLRKQSVSGGSFISSTRRNSVSREGTPVRNLRFGPSAHIRCNGVHKTLTDRAVHL